MATSTPVMFTVTLETRTLFDNRKTGGLATFDDYICTQCFLVEKHIVEQGTILFTFQLIKLALLRRKLGSTGWPVV